MPSFIVADDEAVAARARSVLAFHRKDAPRPELVSTSQAVSRVGREKEVDVVVAALPPDPVAALELLSGLSPLAKGGLIAVGPAADARFVLQALRTGVRDYLDKADLEVELAAALGRLGDRARPAPAQGKVVAVLGPSGGVGASTVAVSLAASLALEHKTAGLVDLKLETGDLAAMLDLRPTFSLADLCKNASAFDKVMLERSFAKHDSGVSLLASPPRLGDADLINADGVVRALDLARSVFPFVVVDVDHTYQQEQAVALRAADVILMVFRLDFNSLRNAHRAQENLGRLGVPADRIRRVVNRAGLPLEVPRAKAEEVLGGAIEHAIPDDPRTAARASNGGSPVVIDAPTSKMGRCLMHLARAVAAPPADVGGGASPRESGRRRWPWRRAAAPAL